MMAVLYKDLNIQRIWVNPCMRVATLKANCDVQASYDCKNALSSVVEITVWYMKWCIDCMVLLYSN